MPKKPKKAADGKALGKDERAARQARLAATPRAVRSLFRDIDGNKLSRAGRGLDAEPSDTDLARRGLAVLAEVGRGGGACCRPTPWRVRSVEGRARGWLSLRSCLLK